MATVGHSKPLSTYEKCNPDEDPFNQQGNSGVAGIHTNKISVYKLNLIDLLILTHKVI